MLRTVRWLLPCLCGCLFLACGGAARPERETRSAEPADLVLRGGTIATVDPGIGVVEALAVDGYTIAAVGSDSEMAAFIGPETEVVELEGRFVMPGFIEGHGHFMSLGESKQILDLAGARSWEEIVGLVAAAVARAQPGEWILGRGWHQDKWDGVPADAAEGVPLNTALNAVAPDRPVLLRHASGHAAIWNDAALALAGVDEHTADPAGGTIVRMPDGRATGLMRETAQELIEPARLAHEARMTPQQRELQLRERARLAAEEALRNGVTSFHDAGSGFETIDFYKRLEAAGELDVRLYVMVRGESNEQLEQQLPRYRMLSEGDDFLTVRSIKRQIDGALGSHGALLLEPYADLPHSSGLMLESVEDIEGTAELAVRHGFQLGTHAIGDRANREMLDLYERVWKRLGVTGQDQRWRIEHAQHLSRTDVPRFAELGVIAAIQAVHCTSDGPWVTKRLGEPRAGQTTQPWRHLLDSGAMLTNGTDVPVEQIDPIASYYSAVSRVMVDGERFHPEHVMTREEALRAYTINNAFAAFEEDVKGSLTPGKYADLVVLSQDLLTAPEAELPETRVEMTFVGGELEYVRGGI